jgi:Aminotransferase class I and II
MSTEKCQICATHECLGDAAVQVERTDLIFFCSPNNPTGAAATREQLTVRSSYASCILLYTELQWQSPAESTKPADCAHTCLLVFAVQLCSGAYDSGMPSGGAMATFKLSCKTQAPQPVMSCFSLQQELVAHARKNGSIIVYDAAYALYISDRNCPKSIFEIEGKVLEDWLSCVFLHMLQACCCVAFAKEQWNV